MKLNRVTIAACSLGFCALFAAQAMWIDIPLGELVADNSVVLVGKIERIRTSQSLAGKFDTAYITVEEVLKNELADHQIETGDKIPLSMPSAVRVSTDIRYKEGREGVWILEYKDETFWATYPKDFQPMTQKGKIGQIIREQAAARDTLNQQGAGGGK